MLRARNTLILVSLSLALVAAVSCTDSEPINIKGPGAAGTPGNGAAGTTGAAGTPGAGAAGTPGAAGTGTTGTAGTTGAAGAGSGTGGTPGVAGTTGSAGSGAGTAGTTGTAGSGADAGTDAGGGGTLSFATDIYPFIKTQCTPCHITATDGNLGMKDAPTAYKSLLGTATPPTGGAATTNLNCTMLDTTKKRVVVGDPTHSFLYIKISQTTAQLMPAGCQPAMPEMPQSTLTLTAAQVTKIHDWIMGGAKP